MYAGTEDQHRPSYSCRSYIRILLCCNLKAFENVQARSVTSAPLLRTCTEPQSQRRVTNLQHHLPLCKARCSREDANSQTLCAALVEDNNLVFLLFYERNLVSHHAYKAGSFETAAWSDCALDSGRAPLSPDSTRYFVAQVMLSLCCHKSLAALGGVQGPSLVQGRHLDKTCVSSVPLSLMVKGYLWYCRHAGGTMHKVAKALLQLLFHVSSGQAVCGKVHRSQDCSCTHRCTSVMLRRSLP